MKVLYDYEIFVRQRYGGISRYFKELLTILAQNEQTELSLYLGINNSGFNLENIQNLKIKQHRLSYPNLLHLFFNFLNRPLFNNYTKKNPFNLFHKTYYSNIGLDLNCKKISTVHDMTHELFPQYFVKSDNTSKLKKKCVDLSDGIICISESTKHDLINIYGLDEKKIKVIYHGISMDGVCNEMRMIKTPYMLYVGQRSGYKNFNILLKAYNSSKSLRDNFKIVCFGGGDFNYSEKLYIKENSLQDKVIHLTGNDYTIGNLYKYAEVLVYTSLYEGFGFPPLEAMRFGCPVLTAEAGSVKEVAGDAALYFNPYDIIDLSQKLDKVIVDKEVRKNLINNGYIQSAKFTWEKCAEETLRFYHKIIKN